MCSEYIKRVPNIIGVPSLFSIIYINKLKGLKNFKIQYLCPKRHIYGNST